MSTHIRILAWINIVLGGLGIALAAVIFLGAAAFQAVIATAAGNSDLPLWILQLVFTLVIGILLVLSLPSLILGWGLYNLRPWARVLGLVTCALSLLNVPLGTAMALYGFWVLLKPESERLFQ